MQIPRECKIRLLDEVSAMIVGLHGDHYEMFHKSTQYQLQVSFLTPNINLECGTVRYTISLKKERRTFIYWTKLFRG